MVRRKFLHYSLYETEKQISWSETNKMKHFFIQDTITPWNSMPQDFQKVRRINGFKSRHVCGSKLPWQLLNTML